MKRRCLKRIMPKAPNKMPELLAPARDQTSFTAAVDAGADAVYFGLGTLNMRINSKGIDISQLPRIMDTAHAKQVKTYVALNTIVYDSDMDILDDLLEKIKSAGADAVIVWDPAVITKAVCLGIPIHISTQANISNIVSARFYRDLGAKRAVLARELSVEQIRQIKKGTDLEIEVFVHGAMCVSVSGRCFMSQFLSCRSANRGDCIQPCRREYTVTDKQSGQQLDISNGYVLSPKDICALAIIDELIDAGIDAFKIEGRNRSPEYIKTVVSAYREAIDAVGENRFNRQLVEELMSPLCRVYNRGFSSGFFLARPGPLEFAKADGSQATCRKIAVGRITNYFKKPKVAQAQVLSAPLQRGEVVQIHGPTTGVIEFKIAQLRTSGRRMINRIEKGQATFPCKAVVRANDILYKIVPAEGTE
ncbi:MAG: U32 family peptidase [Planctomycetota bacterium]